MAIELVEAVYCTPRQFQTLKEFRWGVESRYKHFGFDFKGACQAIADNSGVGYVRTTNRVGDKTYWAIDVLASKKAKRIPEPQLSLFEVIRGDVIKGSPAVKVNVPELFKVANGWRSV